MDMLYTIQEKTATGISLSIRVPADDLAPLLKPAAEMIGQEIEIEGFRKGKAPYAVIRERIGDAKILEAAARSWMERHFDRIIQDLETREFGGKSFEIIGEPAISVTKLAPGEDLEYRMALTILPPIELPDYRAIAKQIRAGKKLQEVSEAEILKAQEWLRESRAKEITVARGARKGDVIEIDFTGREHSVVLEGLVSKNHPLILGNGKFINGFEDAIVGMKSGETREFSLTIPDDYHVKEIAGKNIDFSVTMRSIRERILPEWNDEFAKSLGNFESADALRQSIREGLAAEKEAAEAERIRIAIVEAIAAKTNVALPAAVVDWELEKMVGELERSLKSSGLELNTYLERIKRTVDELKRDWRPDAERRVKIALALREIARREKIEPTDEEVQIAMNRSVTHLGLTEEQVKTLDRDSFADYNRGIARNEKVFRFLETTE